LRAGDHPFRGDDGHPGPAGIHTGEVETINGKSGGIAVMIGARIGALAGPSEILASPTVKDLVAGSGLTFEDADEHELKGVPDRWHLYRVVGERPEEYRLRQVFWRSASE
jgi:class 3 adenylate cyclase